MASVAARKALVCFLICCCFCRCYCSSQASPVQCSNAGDAGALAAIRDEISSPWSTAGGVKCDEATGRVTELNLSKVKFSSSAFPSSLGDLTELRILDMSSDKSSSRPAVELPDSLQNLRNLKHLILSNNGISRLPPWLDQLSSLEVLRLDGVPLAGVDFPASIAKLSSSLKVLDLSRTYDSLDFEHMFFRPRSFPSWLCSLHNLEELHLSHARLTNVPLPTCLSNLTRLQTLRLSFNQITGGIPEDLFTASSSLRAVDLSHNLFTGALPSRVPESLVFLNVAYNSFTGSIPSSLGQFPALSFVGNSGLHGLPLEPSEGQKML